MMAALVLWPDIDAQKPNPPATPEQKTEAQKQQEKDNAPPDLLVHAKTRPMLAYGATIMKGLIPKEMLDKTLRNVEEQKEQAEKEQRQKMLDTLSTPAPPAPTGPSSSEGSTMPTTHVSPESAP
jgi:hypothetical protein